MRSLVFLSVFLTGCTSCATRSKTAAKVAEGSALGAIEGTVVRVAAAGDISNPSISMQKVTSDLVLDGGYDAVLTLGDLQYPRGELENFQRFYDPTWGRFKDLTYPAPGNHEYATTGAAGYFDYFGARAGDRDKGYYSFDLGDWHLVSLNSNCRDIGGCDAQSAQALWLSADLKKTDKACVLAYWHHPRFSSGSHGNANAMDGLWAILANAKADVVLAGHDHVYERFDPMNAAGAADPTGVRAFTVGTGGSSLYTVIRAKEHSAIWQTDTYGILALTLGKGAYRWEFVGVPGGTFTDTGSGSCH